MHSNLNITDRIYGMLSDDDIQQRIDNISKATYREIDQNKEEIKKQLKKIIANLLSSRLHKELNKKRRWYKTPFF